MGNGSSPRHIRFVARPTFAPLLVGRGAALLFWRTSCSCRMRRLRETARHAPPSSNGNGPGSNALRRGHLAGNRGRPTSRLSAGARTTAMPFPAMPRGTPPSSTGPEPVTGAVPAEVVLRRPGSCRRPLCRRHPRSHRQSRHGGRCRHRNLPPSPLTASAPLSHPARMISSRFRVPWYISRWDDTSPTVFSSTAIET